MHFKSYLRWGLSLLIYLPVTFLILLFSPILALFVYKQINKSNFNEETYILPFLFFVGPLNEPLTILNDFGYYPKTAKLGLLERYWYRICTIWTYPSEWLKIKLGIDTSKTVLKRRINETKEWVNHFPTKYFIEGVNKKGQYVWFYKRRFVLTRKLILSFSMGWELNGTPTNFSAFVFSLTFR